MARIVIADDASIMRSQLRTIFERRGDTVVAEAENGQDACKAYVDHRPDLITMDINMPVMTGIEAVKRIKSDFPEANIVMISTENERSLLYEAIKNGAKYYILKPIEEEKVLQVVNQMFGTGKAEVKTETVPKVLSAESAPTESASPEDFRSGLPFAVMFTEGKIVVYLFRQITPRYVPYLKEAITGLSYIDKLKLVFDFGDLNGLTDETIGYLTEWIGHVRRSRGAVALVTENQALGRQASLRTSASVYLNLEAIKW